MTGRIPTTIAVALAAAAVLTARATPAERGDEPLVLTGAALLDLQGKAPGRIVAFRYDGGWSQVPVQIDERTIVDFGAIYNQADTGFTVLTYADTDTYTGADPDATFDADDELVLMAGSTGTQWNGFGTGPAGTIPGSLVELRVRDPLDGNEAWLYLFESDGSLDPAAGTAPIDYTFGLLSGDYKTTYDTNAGPNPEDSTVITGSYTVHFADRWIRDVTSVFAGGATGVDLLDRHKDQFAPGICTRTENTFSEGEGAFIVNRAGPVRALRGYIGANSGPTTHRIHRFYEQREEILTVLRVHAIPGIVDYFDYSPAAAGMIYRDDLNPSGVPLDGSPDAIVTGEIGWQMVTGDQGTLAIAFIVETDVPNPGHGSYYSDTTTPTVTQCTGDAFEYGAGGPFKSDGIPNTDPGVAGTPYRFDLTRVVRYGPPNQPASFGESHHERASQPLIVVVASGSTCDDADGDGWAACSPGCTPPAGTICGDCDDVNARIHPGAHDLCDGADNDCSGAADDAVCADFAIPGTDIWVDGDELAYLGRAFTLCGDPASAWWGPVDYDDDGCILGPDLSILGALFGCGAQSEVCGR